MSRHLAAPATTVRTRTATVVVTDARPLVLAGMAALTDDEAGVTVLEACTPDQLTSGLDRHLPSVLVAGIRDHDPDPFQPVATAKALHPGLNVLVLTDTTSVLDLREAVVAGVDSLMLSTTTLDDLREAIVSTARGERVISPDVAMQLAGARYADRRGQGGGLTPRELEVLQQLAEGRTNAQIAANLGLSARTIKTHVQNLLGKLDTPDRTGAVAQGFRQGLIR